MLFQKRIVSITLDIYVFIDTQLTSEFYALFICSVWISFHCLYNVFKVHAHMQLNKNDENEWNIFRCDSVILTVRM